MRCLGFHVLFIDLIKDGFHILEQVAQKDQISSPKFGEMAGLFKQCIMLLKSFCFDNQKN